MPLKRIRFSWKKILKPGRLWAVISGTVTAAASMYSQIAWLAWISLIPYFITLYQYTDPKSGRRHLFRTGFLFGYSYCVPLASFLYALYPMDVVGIGPLGSVFIILLGQFGATIFYSLPHGVIAAAFVYYTKQQKSRFHFKFAVKNYGKFEMKRQLFSNNALWLISSGFPVLKQRIISAALLALFSPAERTTSEVQAPASSQ